jgi:hypothetical protein
LPWTWCIRVPNILLETAEHIREGQAGEAAEGTHMRMLVRAVTVDLMPQPPTPKIFLPVDPVNGKSVL